MGKLNALIYMPNNLNHLSNIRNHLEAHIKHHRTGERFVGYEDICSSHIYPHNARKQDENENLFFHLNNIQVINHNLQKVIKYFVFVHNITFSFNLRGIIEL